VFKSDEEHTEGKIVAGKTRRERKKKCHAWQVGNSSYSVRPVVMFSNPQGLQAEAHSFFNDISTPSSLIRSL